MTIGGGPRWRRKRFESRRERFSVVEVDKEASQTRDYWVAKNATLRAARPDSSPRKERLFGMTIRLHQYTFFQRVFPTHNEQKQGRFTRAHSSVRGEPCSERWAAARERECPSRRAWRNSFYAQGHKPGLPASATLRAPASLRLHHGWRKKPVAGTSENQQLPGAGILPAVRLQLQQPDSLHRIRD